MYFIHKNQKRIVAEWEIKMKTFINYVHPFSCIYLIMIIDYAI